VVKEKGQEGGYEGIGKERRIMEERRSKERTTSEHGRQGNGLVRSSPKNPDGADFLSIDYRLREKNGRKFLFKLRC